jgi:hypothetical protein
MIDDDDNYGRTFFSIHEKAINFAREKIRFYVDVLKWWEGEDIEEFYSDLESYDEFGDYIYITKIYLDDEQTY